MGVWLKKQSETQVIARKHFSPCTKGSFNFSTLEGRKLSPLLLQKLPPFVSEGAIKQSPPMTNHNYRLHKRTSCFKETSHLQFGLAIDPETEQNDPVVLAHLQVAASSKHLPLIIKVSLSLVLPLLTNQHLGEEAQSERPLYSPYRTESRANMSVFLGSSDTLISGPNSACSPGKPGSARVVSTIYKMQ